MSINSYDWMTELVWNIGYRIGGSFFVFRFFISCSLYSIDIIWRHLSGRLSLLIERIVRLHVILFSAFHTAVQPGTVTYIVFYKPPLRPPIWSSFYLWVGIGGKSGGVLFRVLFWRERCIVFFVGYM